MMIYLSIKVKNAIYLEREKKKVTLMSPFFFMEGNVIESRKSIIEKTAWEILFFFSIAPHVNKLRGGKNARYS